MYTPLNTSFASGVTTMATVDLSLHSALGVSWKILLPYTIFGAILIVYSQSRLYKGQFAIARTNKKLANVEVRQPKNKATKPAKSSLIKSVNYPINYK